MRTIRNILLGLVALTIGLSITAEAQNNKLHKKQKSDEGWISVGPANFSGRVLAVHVDNRDSRKIYVGTAGGGLWISTNDGVTWNRCTNYPGSVAVSAIAQDADGKIYIGTGEAYGLEDPGVETNIKDYGIVGDGIYVTENDIDFTLLSGSDDWEVIKNIVYSSTDNTMYIGTEIGLKKYSISQGTLSDAHTDQRMVTDLSIGTDGTIVYSCCAAYVADVFLKRPSDGSFTSVCGTSATKLPNDAGRISVAIAPSDHNIMYAYATNNNTGHFEGVYKSTDKGNAWRKIYSPPSYNGPSGHPTNTSGMGFYCNVIAVSPDLASNVYVGTTHLYDGNELTVQDTDGNNIYSWMPVPYKSGSSYGELYFLSYTNKGFFVGIGDGLYRSTNNGVSFSALNRYLNNLQASSFSVANEGQILLSARDKGSLYMSNPINSTSQAEPSLTSVYGSGINNASSMIKSEAIFYTDITGSVFRMASINSDVQKPSNWYGTFDQLRNRGTTGNTLKELPRWFRSSDATQDQSNIGNPGYYHSNVSPIIFWESVNDLNSIDTVEYTADKSYAPGERISVRSARNAYPIKIINNSSDTLYKDSVLYVQDIVTSRFFLGGSSYVQALSRVGAPVFMTTNALDFNTTMDDDWSCVFRTNDITEQVIELQVSKDGEHLFILTKKQEAGITANYSIYRVSGFDTYRQRRDIEVSEFAFFQDSTTITIGTNNMHRKLINDTLVFESQIGSDIIQGDILSIVLDPQDDNKLLYTTNGIGAASRVNLITNATTATFDNVILANKVGTGIPAGPVYTAIIEMNDSEIAYIGTEKGVYTTSNFDDANPSWDFYNKGIDANVPVFKLLQQTRKLNNDTSIYYTRLGEKMEIIFPGIYNEGIIYAATHGLGMFMDKTYHNPLVNVPSYRKPTVDNALKVYPNPTNNKITIDFTLLKDEQVQLNIIDITGKIVSSNNIGNRDIGLHSEIINCSNLPSGMYFVNLKTNTQNKTAKIIVTK
jgi:photosystem II stability/assembly factor-like uncharacterized protein